MTDDIEIIKGKLSEPIDTTDLVDRIQNITRVDWFKNQFAGWNNQKLVKFSQTLSKYGSCFSFNIDKFTDIFRIDQLSRLILSF